MGFINQTYYRIRPFIPRRLQIAARRRVAAAKRRLCRDVWPIDANAGKPPQGWCGWPDGKRFAFVLTHDVEKSIGHDKCGELMDFEMSAGFRSSFNFVAKRYETSKELRALLTEKGFEVGNHGLYHDGRLFKSRKTFDERAVLINQYLKEWGAVGFNSPSNHRNLGWIHELDIEYDQSTFDTDPFEPEPEGVGTIFPFAVFKNGNQPVAVSGEQQAASSRSPSFPASKLPNYVASPHSGLLASQPSSLQAQGSHSFFIELPYTLSQDFSLFVILKEKEIRIWKEKLDWIAEKGGMALLNAHPDYMNCQNRRCGLEEYPIRFYEEFLHYVKDRYEGQYWHVLPRGMARFWKEEMVNSTNMKAGKLES